MDVNTNKRGGKLAPYLLLFISLIVIGISLTACIVDSFDHIPLVLVGIGLFLLVLSELKKGVATVLKIVSSAAFVIGIFLGAFFWGAGYIKMLLIFVGCMFIIIVYIVIANRVRLRKS